MGVVFTKANRWVLVTMVTTSSLSLRYCQGMGVVVSTFLLILEESEVFWLMSCIIEDHLPSHYYNTNLFGIQVTMVTGPW